MKLRYHFDDTFLLDSKMPEFVRTDWKNNPSTETPINADNLNKIEDCLVDLTYVDVHNFNLMTGTGDGIIYRLGNMCQFVISMSNPLAVGGKSDLLQFPDGFKPAMNFYTQAMTDVYGETVGLVAYDRTANKLSLNTSSQDAFNAKISFSYICDV